MFKNDNKINKAKISKNEIFEKSIALFSDEGIDNVTMRDLASACQLSPGAFYYHFKNKDDLILYFYKKSLDGHLSRGVSYLKTAPKDLSIVMKWICHDRFKEFEQYKTMLEPMASKIDLQSPRSFMSKESYQIRKESVTFFSKVASQCLGINNELASIVGRALWLHHLLILSTWLRDTEGDQKGVLLLSESIRVWKWIPLFLKIPGSKKMIHKMTNSLKRIGFWEDYHD